MELKVILISVIMAVAIFQMEVTDGAPQNKPPVLDYHPAMQECAPFDGSCMELNPHKLMEQEKKHIQAFAEWEAVAEPSWRTKFPDDAKRIDRIRAKHA